MSDEEAKSVPGPSSSPDFVFSELKRRSDLSKIGYEYESWEDLAGIDDPGFATLDFPNGRATRRVSLSRSRAEQLLKFDFENLVYLADFEAIWHRGTNVVEATLTGSPSSLRIALRRISTAVAKHSALEVASDLDDDEQPLSQWELEVRKGSTVMRISEIDPDSLMGALSSPRRSITLRIEGANSTTHDEAVALLTKVGGAMLFELDLMHGVPVRFTRKRIKPRQRRRARQFVAPKFPANEYLHEPLALYEYGRAAAGLPLLEFLAYYQSLEFFFPTFMHEKTANALRRTLLDPGFDPTEELSMIRLIALAAPAVRAGGGEREQLRATVAACVDENELRELLDQIDPEHEYFTEKKQAIKGLQPIRMAGAPGILEQVSDRIYDIRCRVVHTKQEGGNDNELLLPSSRESDSLGPDITVLRFISQRALIARARRR